MPATEDEALFQRIAIATALYVEGIPTLHDARASALNVKRCTQQICEHCGMDRRRASYYNAPCYTEGEWLQGSYIPGPARIAHSWVIVEVPC